MTLIRFPFNSQRISRVDFDNTACKILYFRFVLLQIAVLEVFPDAGVFGLANELRLF